jgi:hypothetical protein
MDFLTPEMGIRQDFGLPPPWRSLCVLGALCVKNKKAWHQLEKPRSGSRMMAKYQGYFT